MVIDLDTSGAETRTCYNTLITSDLVITRPDIAAK